MDIIFINGAYLVAILFSFLIAERLDLTQIGYPIAFLASALTLLFYALKAKRVNRPIKKPLIKMLFCGCAASIMSFITLIAANRPAGLVAYTAFFICINGSLYYLLDFSIVYTNYRQKFPFLKKILLALFAADTLSLLINIFTCHVFDITQVAFGSGMSYIILQKMPYQLHLSLSYISAFLTVMSLAIKSLHSPRLYRNKYRVLLYSFAAVLVLDALCIFLQEPVNYSVAFFGLLGGCFSWFSLYYTPKKLRSIAMNLTVDSMKDGVIFFDADGKCVYRNTALQEMIKEYAKIGVDIKEALEKWRGSGICQRTSGDFNTRHNFEHRFSADGKNYCLDIWFNNLKEEGSDRHLGFFFTVHDKTQEEDRINHDRFLATHDPLTGLYNKSYFYQKAKETLEMDAETDYLMLCSDFYNFKLINRMFGMETGDSFLRRTAEMIRSIAASDAVYGYLNGDRFAMLVRKDLFSEKAAHEAMERIELVDSAVLYPVNIYIGVYEITDVTIPVSAMCAYAITAMKTVKGSLKKKIAYYDDSQQAQSVRVRKLIEEFKYAVSMSQFKMFLQPQFSADGRMIGAEALARWIHPLDGMIQTDEFLPILEENGLISELDKVIWDAAACQLKKWQDMGLNWYISVNVSPVDFCRIDVYELLTGIVKKYGISPKALRIEISESAILMDIERQQQLTERLRGFGFDIEIDAFGRGSLSFNSLKQINFNILKIDMNFFAKTKNEKRSAIILQNITELAKELGMSIVAKFVETQEQFEFLAQIGSDCFQGFYFAEPMSTLDFEHKYIGGGK